MAAPCLREILNGHRTKSRQLVAIYRLVCKKTKRTSKLWRKAPSRLYNGGRRSLKALVLVHFLVENLMTFLDTREKWQLYVDVNLMTSSALSTMEEKLALRNSFCPRRRCGSATIISASWKLMDILCNEREVLKQDRVALNRFNY